MARKNRGRRRRMRRKVSKAVKQYVKGVLDNQIEDKYLTFAWPETSVPNSNQTSTSSCIYLSGIQKGVDQGQRISNRVSIKSIRANFVLYSRSSAAINPAAVPPNAEFRWALSAFKQPNLILASTPATTGYAAAEGNSVWSIATQDFAIGQQRNFLGYPSVKVLKTGTAICQAQGTMTSDYGYLQTHKVSFVIRFKRPLKVTYNNNNTGDVTSILKNGLWLNIISTAAGTNYLSG